MASFTKREILEHIVGNTELTPAINYILKKLNVCEKYITSDKKILLLWIACGKHCFLYDLNERQGDSL